MLDGLYVQLFGAWLFCLAFLFLWRHSGVKYFGFWSIAWAVETVAWIFMWFARITGSSRWLAPHALLEFGFALSLVAAARVGSEHSGSSWRSAIRQLYFFPAFLLILEFIGWDRHHWYGALHSVVLSAIYLYSFRELGMGPRRFFHFTLLALSLFYLQDAIAYGYMAAHRDAMPGWIRYMDYAAFYDVALKTALAFSAMAMWIENQHDRVVQIGKELDQARRLSARDESLDYLTGLLSPDALRRRMDSSELFAGAVVVCDLDGFKAINDRFGHMVGDEVLRNVGNLLRSSIRAEDQAYRWGGDEFAVLFQEQTGKVARNRMKEIEARLHDFHVRGHGTLVIQFSWGVVEARELTLKDALEQADREMYRQKSTHPGRAGEQPLPKTS